MKFEMIKHPNLPMGSHSDSDGRTWSKAGSVIESDKPLHKLFPDRFKKAAPGAKLTDPDIRPEVLALEDDEDVLEPEVRESPPKPVVPPKDAKDEKKVEPKKPAKTAPPAKEEPEDDDEEDDDEDDDEPEAKKDEGEDVTKSFKAAKEADLTVHRVKTGPEKGFHVKEDGKALHPKPLANKAAVDKFLKERDEDEE